MSKRTLFLVGLVVAGWVAIGATAPATRRAQATADEPQYLMSAISLGEDFDLDISDERAEQRYRVFHAAGLPWQELPRADGRAVSPHDPLLPALLALPMRAGGWIAAKLTLAALAGVLAAALVWVSVVRFSVPVRIAVIGTLAFSAAAPLAIYGTQVYPELPAALAVTFAIAALTGPMGRRGTLLVGASVVALPWLSVKYAPVALALGALAVVHLWRAADRNALVTFLGAIAAAAGVFAVAHLAWYGGLTPYASGDHFVGGETTVMGVDPNYPGRAIRLVALVLDRDFGLAAWHPAFLLAVPAFAVLLRDRPRHWAVLALPLAAGWLNATFLALTMHGWWWPGRQTVVVLPCVVLVVTWWVASRPVALRTLAVAGVMGASVFAWLVAQAAFGDLTTVVTFEQISHPLVRVWRAVLPDYRARTPRDWALHAVWLLALITTIVAVVRPRIPWGSIRPVAKTGATTS